CRLGRAELANPHRGPSLSKLPIQPSRIGRAALPRVRMSLRLANPPRRPKSAASLPFRAAPRVKLQIFLDDRVERAAADPILEVDEPDSADSSRSASVVLGGSDGRVNALPRRRILLLDCDDRYC